MSARPILTTGEEHIAFYMAIGRAVTQWAHIENGLYHVANRVFGEDTAAPLAFGFMSIENFRSKLAFVDRAFGTAIFYREFELDWAEVREQVRGLSSRRNEIAHGRVIIYPHSKPGRRFAIVPTFAPEPKRRQKVPTPPSGSLCVRDIDLAQRQFSRAAARLHELYFRIGGEGEQPGAPAQPEPKSQSLAQLRRQIDAMHRPPERSSRG